MRNARKPAEERANPAALVFQQSRVWDEFDNTAHKWAEQARKRTQAREARYGDAAIRLGELQPVESIWQVEWGAALNFKRSDGGRCSGVYFVLLPGSRLVVVKPDADVVADYCGYMIAHIRKVHDRLPSSCGRAPS